MFVIDVSFVELTGAFFREPRRQVRNCDHWRYIVAITFSFTVSHRVEEDPRRRTRARLDERNVVRSLNADDGEKFHEYSRDLVEVRHYLEVVWNGERFWFVVHSLLMLMDSVQALLTKGCRFESRSALQNSETFLALPFSESSTDCALTWSYNKKSFQQQGFQV